MTGLAPWRPQPGARATQQSGRAAVAPRRQRRLRCFWNRLPLCPPRRPCRALAPGFAHSVGAGAPRCGRARGRQRPPHPAGREVGGLPGSNNSTAVGGGSARPSGGPRATNAYPPPQRATVLPMHPHSLPSSSLLRKVRSVSVRPGRGARRPVEQKGRLPGEAAAAGKATAPTATPCRWRQGACACACIRVCACVCMCCACALCACVHTCAHACARVCPSGFSGGPWPIKPFSMTSQGGGARA